MLSETLIVIISLVSLILSIISTIIGIFAFVEARSLAKSTHSVQLMPVDPEIDAHNQKIIKEWATKEETLEKQRKMAKEELEDKLPEFYEEETEIISY